MFAKGTLNALLDDDAVTVVLVELVALVAVVAVVALVALPDKDPLKIPAVNVSVAGL